MAEPGSLPTAQRAELERAVREYELAEKGDVRIVLLEGRPDTGKGRILQEVRRRVGLDVPFVEGVCDPTRPFAPFAGIVEATLELLGRLGVAPRVDRESLGCGQGCHELWYQHVGMAASHVAVPSLDRRLRFFAAVRQLLVQLSQHRPPVVAVRRLDRADRGTVELLSFLGEAVSPWEAGDGSDEGRLRALVVGTVEDSGPSATWEGAPLAELLRLPCTVTLHVAPLDRAGVARYLSSDEIVDAVLERTGGLPGRIDRLLATDLPSLEMSVEHHLEHLSGAARSLFEALAVLGQPASIDQLERVAGGAAGSAACAEFGRSDLLRRTIVDGRALFDFAEPRVRSVVRRAMSEERRAELHRASAEICASMAGREVDAARHALRGGSVERATELALQAWPVLLASHAYSAAAELFESLVEATASAEGADETAVPRDVRLRLVDLYRVMGDVDQALEHAHALRRTEPESPAAAMRVGFLLARQGDLEVATNVMQQGLGLANRVGDPEVMAEAQLGLAELAYRARDLSGARSLATAAQSNADKAASLPLSIEASVILCRVLLAEGSGAETLQVARKALAEADRGRLHGHHAQLLNLTGAAELMGGHEAAAEHAFVHAVRVASEAMAEEERAVALEHLAVLAHRRGDYALAHRHYHTAAQVLRAMADPEQYARVVFDLALLYNDVGDPFRARRLCNQAKQVGGAARVPDVAAEGAVIEGQVELELGNTDRATQCFRQALELARRHDLPAARFNATLGLARAAIEDGDVSAATQLLGNLETGRPWRDEVQRALVDAELARARGRQTLAHARTALALAERGGDPTLRLRASLPLIRSLIDEGRTEEARAALDVAGQLDAELVRNVPEDCVDVWPERREGRELRELQVAVGLERPSAPPPPPSEPGQERVGPAQPLERLVGASSAMRRVKDLVARVASSDATVLIRGESGTGKELVADALHRLSPRASGPFVRVNCAAMVDTLLASELFGHEKGAFTGAHARKKGWFELADGGTLFLDEIGDVSARMQAALLRVLQEHTFERVGGTTTVRVDVRVIAATHRDLEAMVEREEFRQDLYYRLCAVTIPVPPLRRRLDDLPALAGHLLGRIAEETGGEQKSLSEGAIRFLQSHRWPGNVRELENVLRSTALLSESSVLGPRDFGAYAEHLDGEALDLPQAAEVESETGLSQLFYDRIRKGETSIYDVRRELEKESIARALSETGGNITRAAQLLGMKRPRLSQLVKEYGLGR